MPNPYVAPLKVDIADGTQVVNTTTETVISPNYSFAANDASIFQGTCLRVTAGFDVSNVVTTPGTITFRLRWGGVAGTVLCATSAIQMDTTARANFSGRLQAEIIWRSIGSAGSAFAQGVVFLNNVADAAAAAPQYFTMGSAGANVPAVVGSLDTTTAKDLALSAQFSVANASNQITCHYRILEAVWPI